MLTADGHAAKDMSFLNSCEMALGPGSMCRDLEHASSSGEVAGNIILNSERESQQPNALLDSGCLRHLLAEAQALSFWIQRFPFCVPTIIIYQLLSGANAARLIFWEPSKVPQAAQQSNVGAHGRRSLEPGAVVQTFANTIRHGSSRPQTHNVPFKSQGQAQLIQAMFKGQGCCGYLWRALSWSQLHHPRGHKVPLERCLSRGALRTEMFAGDSNLRSMECEKFSASPRATMASAILKLILPYSSQRKMYARSI